MPADHKAARNVALNASPCASDEHWIDASVLNLAAAYLERDSQYKELLRLETVKLDADNKFNYAKLQVVLYPKAPRKFDFVKLLTEREEADAALRAAIEKGEKDVSGI